MFRSAVTFILGALFACALIYFFLPRNPFLLLALIPAPFFLIFWMNRPDILMIWIFALQLSGLRIPGTPEQLKLYEILEVVFITITFAGMFIHKQKRTMDYYLQKLVLLFLGILVLTMAIRGTGFRVLGDENWGGFRYVPLFLNGLFLLNSSFITLSSKQLRHATYWMLALAFIPSISEFLAIASRGVITFQYYFIQLTNATVSAFYANQAGDSLVRLQSASSAAVAILYVALIKKNRTGAAKLLCLALILLSFILRALTGHRLTFVGGLLLIFLYLFVFAYQKRKKLLFFTLISIFGFSGVSFAYILGPSLPSSAQRMISFLPGVKIDPVVAMDASYSTEWRLNMWKDAMAEIPSHLLVGKGYTYPPGAVEVVDPLRYIEMPYYWAIVTSNYHNGPLELLICTGIPGLFFGLLALWYSVYLSIKRQRSGEWEDLFLKRIHFVFTLDIIVRGIIFCSLFGSVTSDISNLFIRMAFLEAIYRSGSNRIEPVESEEAQLKVKSPKLVSA
ncbi:O-antigen ligase family protein [Kiritimatiellaeota bacterium B1221]|nr:O-antigen ligase family protein [Kiritimatiellaeota bacterium B1221]